MDPCPSFPRRTTDWPSSPGERHDLVELFRYLGVDRRLLKQGRERVIVRLSHGPFRQGDLREKLHSASACSAVVLPELFGPTNTTRSPSSISTSSKSLKFRMMSRVSIEHLYLKSWNPHEKEYRAGWQSGPQPSYGGVFVDGAAGVLYSMDNGLTLRAEAGIAGLKLGVGWLF